MKTYPTLVTFILAESVRPEVAGTHTLVGVIAGDALLLPAEARTSIGSKENPAAIASLAVYAAFKGGEGKFTAQVSIIDPTGKCVNVPHTVEVEQKPPGAMTIILPMSPFPVKALGKFRIIFKLDEHEYPYQFTVDAAQPKVEQVPRRSRKRK